MNILSKMMIALRGESAGDWASSGALNLLDEEIQSAYEDLDQSKKNLSAVLAQQKSTSLKLDELKSLKLEYEEYAVKALDKKNDALAYEVAEKIIAIKSQLRHQQSIFDEAEPAVNKLRITLKITEQSLLRLQQQADTLKATENVQKAQESVSKRLLKSNSKLHTARDSLSKIKRQQDNLEAIQELAIDDAYSDDLSLKIKLEQAGIHPGQQTPQELLNSLKKSD